MLTAGAIVGISVGLAFLAGVCAVILHTRYSWRRYRAKHPESDKKGKDPEQGDGGANGGVFAMTSARAGETESTSSAAATKGKQPVYAPGMDPAQHDLEMEAVGPANGAYGYSLDAMVEGHNQRMANGTEGQVAYPHGDEYGRMPGSEQQDDEIRAAGPSHSPTSVQRKPVAQSPVPQSPEPRSPVAHSPLTRSPASRSPVGRSPASRSPASRSPVARSPASGSPVARSPVTRSPVARSPVARSPASAQQPQHIPPDDLQEVGRAI